MYRMGVSQRCQYALRAVYELASSGAGPVKIATIARRQAIPAKLLEAILNEPRRGAFVESLRGNEGGYRLARPAARLTVGDILRFCDGPLLPVRRVKGHKGRR